MKNKLVLWGSNAQDERVLLAMELRPVDNKVDLYVFPESVATEEFSKQMMDEWRDDKPVEFPETFEKSEQELSISESLLPEDLRVERTDVVQRAQTEWHFVVLSTKLHQSYESELEELRDRVHKLEQFDDSMWETLKSFWDKVQTHIRDRNLLREHAGVLRSQTNELFSRMKELRARLDDEFKQVSKNNVDHYMGLLEEVEQRISEGMRLQNIFEDLKAIQRQFRDANFTREHRSKVWKRLDAAFKTVKEKRFGDRGDDRSPFERLRRRYDGLLAAIDKMNRSIQRDEKDLEFQNRKIASTDGQLEAQIRQAKIKMIEERIRSKKEKLGEMQQTREELERRLEKEKEKEAQRQEQKRLEEARKEAEAKIAEKIRQEAAARKEEAEKLEKAAGAIGGEKEPAGQAQKTTSAEPKAPPRPEKEESLTEAIETTLGESLQDVIDTVRAVAEVVSDRIGESLDELRQELSREEPAVQEEEAVEEPVSGEGEEEKK